MILDLVGGGAAGVELDRYDLEFGTPHKAFLLARSENHTNLMLQVNEEIHFSVRGYHGGGTENPMVRADMIYYKTPKDGALIRSWITFVVWKSYLITITTIMSQKF